MTMIYDLAISKHATHEALQAMTSQLTGVEPKYVLVVPAEVIWEEVGPEIKVACAYRLDEGEFPMSLDIESLSAEVTINEDIPTIERLCLLLGCRALLEPDGPHTPFDYLEIDGINPPRMAAIDQTLAGQRIMVIRQYWPSDIFRGTRIRTKRETRDDFDNTLIPSGAEGIIAEIMGQNPSSNPLFYVDIALPHEDLVGGVKYHSIVLERDDFEKI